MPAIKFTGTAAPAVSLGVRNWSADAADHANVVGWWTLREGRATLDTGRIASVAPRVGSSPLVRNPSSAGPLPATFDGLSAADFTAAQLNGLYCARTVPRDAVSVVVIARLETPFAAQNRNLFGLYGSGDHMKVYRPASGLYSWRTGSTDAAQDPTPYQGQGPLMVIAERSGNAVSLRMRTLTATGTVRTGTLTPSASIPANVQLVLGQDEISDGHINAAPNAAHAWSDGMFEAALYSGPVLSSPSILAFWDAYFAAIYGATA